MPQSENQNWGRFLGIGLEVAVGVLLGFLAGRWLDTRYGWNPWGTVIGSMLGLAGGLYLLLKQALKMNKD